jgi:hypothetical protein
MTRSNYFVVITAMLLTRSAAANAFSTGITGLSGKQGIICNACHSGGKAPAVHFEGPADVTAGVIATFRFVVQSQSASQTFAGFNVADNAGQLAVEAGQGEQLLGAELTHTRPKPNDSTGTASFEFTWQAPVQPGPYTLFGAGNSVNFNGNNSGDRAAATTFMISVAADAPPTPTATATPPPTATPSPPPSDCTGDCDGDGGVTINELITGVNLALGGSAASTCAAFDANGDGEVTIDELLVAVNRALNGCP